MNTLYCVVQKIRYLDYIKDYYKILIIYNLLLLYNDKDNF